MAAFNVSVPKVQVAIDRAWRDPILNTQYIAHVEALRAQLARQTIQLGPTITGSGKDAKQITQTIFWPVACTTTLAACSDECVVATGEATDDSQDVVLTCLQEAGFVESYKRFRPSPLAFDSVVALQFLVKMKALDEYLTTQYIAFLEANKGDHEYALEVGSDNAGDWEIPATEWNIDLIPQFMLAAKLANFQMPYMLDGTNFWTQIAKARAFSANSDGKGENNLFGEFQFVQDEFNMVSAAPNKTYMVNASAVAFISGNFWSQAPTEFAGTHRMWKMQSKNLPGIFYDVHEIEACSSNDFVTSWKIRVNGAFVLNPLGCEEGRTGILAFEKLPGV